jgi:preprotein translocase subunit SecD
MQRHLTTKTIVIVATILICLFGIFGIPRSTADLLGNPRKNIKLGLDLRGGSYLILQVQVQDAIRSEALRNIDSMKQELRKRGIEFANIDCNEPKTIQEADSIQITAQGIPAAKSGDFRSVIADRFPQWTLTPVDATNYKLSMKPNELIDLKSQAVAQSISTIENRVNALGLTEPSVTQYGRSDTEYEILVQLPDIDDPEHVKDIIGQVAQLEIDEVKGKTPYPSQEAAMSEMGGVLPLNTKLAFWPRGGEKGQWYLVSRNPVVVGQDLRSARPGRDENGHWEASFSLSQDGAQRFEAFTSAHIGDQLAVLLDDQIKSVAEIKSAISDSGRIMGLTSQQEASDLALVLKSGSLPAKLVYEQVRTVGPSLGADSIREGLYAGVAGLAAVIIVMLAYYKKSGVNAVLALLLNTVILMAALSYFNATLTLPGIAGIILTIGMAVDSNVLIFERIREELRSGKAVPAAIDAGFGKAWWTIVDTHVTTIVSCLFLFLFGTGPVRGFAVTLVIGLLANVFTAVFVSKVIFDYEMASRKQVATLSI